MKRAYPFQCRVYEKNGDKTLLEINAGGNRFMSGEITGYGNLSIECRMVPTAVVCRLALQLIQPVKLHVGQFTACSLICSSVDRVVDSISGRTRQKVTYQLLDGNYMLCNAHEGIAVHFPKGKHEVFVLLSAVLCPGSEQRVFPMPPKMTVYFQLMQEAMALDNTDKTETSLFALLYYALHNNNRHTTHYPSSYYMQVYKMGYRITADYQVPDIVRRVIRSIKMDKRPFYAIFKELYGLNPVGLCMQERFFHEKRLKKYNPNISENLLSAEIGFGSVSNYRRAKQKFASP